MDSPVSLKDQISFLRMCHQVSNAVYYVCDRRFLAHSSYIVKEIYCKECTVLSRRSYKIVPLINLNKYLHNDTSETEVNINISVNNGSELF